MRSRILILSVVLLSAVQQAGTETRENVLFVPAKYFMVLGEWLGRLGLHGAEERSGG